jgi:serine/threonine protein kinase
MVWSKGRKLQDGKYVIEKELDQGGFGITYLVKRDDGQKFVVKTLNDDMQKSLNFSKYQQNFVNEALRLARYSHPHIVRVEELIQELNLWGIVMEYVEGETLADLVKQEGLLSQDRSLRYIRQVGDALVLVHQNGFLHRDVKPRNIMVRASCDEAVLIDFGMARDFEQYKTQSNTQFLSRYFSPIEQYDKRAKCGAYTDVYALAGTLYYLVTGEYPIAAPNRAVGMDLDLPSQYNSDLDDWLENAILKGLEIKPSDRSQSIQEWLDLLVISQDNKAIASINKALKLDSKNHEYWHYKSTILYELGENEKAIISINRALKLDNKNFQYWNYKAIILHKLGEVEEAVDCYDVALELCPNSHIVWLNRAITLKLDEDAESYIEALKSCIKSLEIKTDYDEAIKLYKNIVEEIKDYYYYECFECLEYCSDYYEKKIFSLLFLEHEIDEENFGSCIERGNALFAIQDYQQATRFFKLAISINPTDPLAWNNYADVMYHLKNYDRVIEILDKVLRLNSEDNDAWIMRGKALENLGRYSEAKESYKKSDPAFGYNFSPTLYTIPSGRILYYETSQTMI